MKVICLIENNNWASINGEGNDIKEPEKGRIYEVVDVQEFGGDTFYKLCGYIDLYHYKCFRPVDNSWINSILREALRESKILANNTSGNLSKNSINFYNVNPQLKLFVDINSSHRL